MSETFIAQEILALEERGLDIRIVSLRHPTGDQIHPIHKRIAAPILYLPEYLHQEPRRFMQAWRAARRRPAYSHARSTWLGDLRRDRTRNRARRFGQAMVLARELWPDVVHLHAHFMHTPGSVARYASRLTGLPWTCSAHARDIWTSPDWEKREKLLRTCRPVGAPARQPPTAFVDLPPWRSGPPLGKTRETARLPLVGCTAANRVHLQGLAPHPERVELLYHGLDLQRFPIPPIRPSSSDTDIDVDGSNPSAPVVILSVGRAVEKKGYDDLLDALAQLPPQLNWTLQHVGGGEGLAKLAGRANALGLGGRVSWLGPLTQDAVLKRYRGADLFVLASRIARDGDRDGLPNVLMEAQSQGLACLATHVSAIPELIEDGVTGSLVEPRDPPALARELERLILDPRLRERLGRAGQRRVRERFHFVAGIERLMSRFRACLPAEPAPSGEPV